MPSIYPEGLSRVALEASLLGIPVAAFHNRGISTVIKDGQNGELTMDTTPHGISKVIELILKKYDFYQSKSQELAPLIAKKYCAEESNSCVLESIDKLLNEKKIIMFNNLQSY